MKLKQHFLPIGILIAVCILLLWLAGVFSPKVPTQDSAPGFSVLQGKLVEARLAKIPMTEQAIGAVQAANEASVASRILSRVVELNLKAGQIVKAGETLVRLDDTEIRAKLQQAEANVSTAETALKQAEIDEKRIGSLLKSSAASQQDYDKVATNLKSATSELKRAAEFANEIKTMLGYATIISPMDGMIVDKKVNAGDTVSPGQSLLKIYDPKQMQLVASVRESLTSKLRVGQSIGVKVDALNKVCAGAVSEIVPESSSESRSFQVKVTGPCPAGIYSGMSGRIIIPLGDEDVLLIPKTAVKRSGQIELVDAMENGKIVRRAVRTGRDFGSDVEILSGLKPGEMLLAAPAQEGDSAHGE